jgi:hypothetical protein
MYRSIESVRYLAAAAMAVVNKKAFLTPARDVDLDQWNAGRGVTQYW